MAVFSLLGWASERMELVVPYGVGGASDLVARAMSQDLGNKINKNIVVMNRPGANTKIGTNYVLKNPADGNTLILISSWIFLNPSQYKNPGFDIADFDLTSPFGYSPIVLAVKANSPIKNWNDFIAHAKSKNLNCGVHGEAPKFISQLLMKKINMPNLQIVNYKSYGDHMMAIVSGNIDCGIATKQEFMKSHSQNDLRIIAVSSPTQLSALPNVKLFNDIDPGLSISAVYSLGVLSTTPRNKKDAILTAAKEVIENRKFQQSLIAMGIDIYPGRVDYNGQKWAIEQFEKVERLRADSAIDKIE